LDAYELEELVHSLDAFDFPLGSRAPDGQGNIGDANHMRLFVIALAFDITLLFRTQGQA
jgi:hypothetical protein